MLKYYWSSPSSSSFYTTNEEHTLTMAVKLVKWVRNKKPTNKKKTRENLQEIKDVIVDVIENLYVFNDNLEIVRFRFFFF